MKITNLFILLFIMSAFAIGISIQDDEINNVNEAINNASLTIQNIEIGKSENDYLDGIFIVVEKYMVFVGTFAFEGMKLGINFGQKNPEYFEQDFIFKIIKLLVCLALLSLLIQPLFYLIVLIVIGLLWIIELKNKRKKNE